MTEAHCLNDTEYICLYVIWPVSPKSKEMQIQTTVRYHSTRNKILKI